MARPTLDKNVKYKLLLLRAKALGLTKPQVRGLLETMWDVCHECGDIRFQTAEHVEAACEWWGEAGAWANLISGEGTNFIDRLEGGAFEVHDYWHHCPDYVKSRLRQERRRSETSEKFGTVPNNLEKFATPAPAPAPTPIKKDISSEAPQTALSERVKVFEPTASKPFATSKGPYRVRGEDVHSWFPVRDCKDPRGWPFFHAHGNCLVERFTASGEDPGSVEAFVEAQIRKAQGWLLEHPSRQKTPKGMPAFLSGWIERNLNKRGAAA